MNSLGIGSSGKQFSLIPNNNYKEANDNFAKSIMDMKKHKSVINRNIGNKKQSNILDSFKNDILSLKQKNSTKTNSQNQVNKIRQSQNDNGNSSGNGNGENLNENYNNYSVNQHTTKIQKKIFEVNWSEVFTTVCKKKLYNTFRSLKEILNQFPHFSNLFVCFIDEACAKFLIDKNHKVATLRIMLSSWQNSQIKNIDSINIKNSSDINRALDLIQQLEYLGPSNNLLIALDIEKIKFLQENFLDNNQLYWPNGNDGITWLTSI